MNKLLSKLLVLGMLLGMTLACNPKDGPDPEPPTPEIPEDSGSFGVYKSELKYYGTDMAAYLGVELPVWQYTVYDSTLFHSGNTEGKIAVINFTVNESANFNAGVPVGKYIILSAGSSTEGSIVSSYYYSIENPEERVYLEPGSILEIIKHSDTHYTFDAEFMAGGETVIDYSITRSLDSEDFIFKDETFRSDLREDYVQDLTTVQAFYWGDTLNTGTAVWKIHLYGDGAIVSEDGIITNDKGTYISLQYYTEVGDNIFEGTYNMGEAMKFKVGTMEPGTDIAEIGNYGTWMYFIENNYIIDGFPMTDGELVVTPSTDGTYKVEFNLYDDNPNKKNKISATYQGEVKVVDLTSTGDYSEVSFTWADNKYSPENKNWEVELISAEYSESQGKEGYIIDLVINTIPEDTFFSLQYLGTSQQGASFDLVKDSDESFVMRKATVREFKNGQESTHEIVEGNFYVKPNIDGNTRTMEVNSFKTQSGTVYDGTFRGLEKQIDPGDKPVDTGNAVFETEGAEVRFEYYGVASNNRSDWYISMLNKEYIEDGENGGEPSEKSLQVSLDLYIVDGGSFEDGIPTGTYDFIGGNPTATGITTELDVTFYKYFGIMKEISEGSVTITQKSSNEYKIELDFKTASGETLTGGYEGVVKMQSYSY